MQKYRNTPALLEEGFAAECKAVGVIEVTQECFERIMQALANDNNQSVTEMLEVLEDYNHAYVFNGKHFLATSYLAQYNPTMVDTTL